MPYSMRVSPCKLHVVSNVVYIPIVCMLYESSLFVAHQLRVSDDRMTVTGEKGYCVVRANHGIVIHYACLL